VIVKRLAFFNGLKLALDTIRGHKLRAFLTVLGVIIGTGTIIASAPSSPDSIPPFPMCSAASARIRLSSSSFRWPARRQPEPEERTRKDLTYENAVDIKERCKAVEDVSPMIFPNKTVNVRFKATTCTTST